MGKHHLNLSDGEYLLRDIIDCVRNRGGVNKSIPIVLFTQFENRLQNKHAEVLEALEDVWSTANVTRLYLAWRTKRLVDRSGRARIPQLALVNTLLAALEAGAPLPWKNEVHDLLKAYRTATTPIARAQEARKGLTALFRKLASGREGDKVWLETAFSRCLNALSYAENVNLAASPDTWGHFLHVVNVFLLGYYILNFGGWDFPALARAEFGNTPADPVEALNQSWVLASVFHDAGKAAENLKDLKKNLNNLLETIDPKSRCEIAEPHWRTLKVVGGKPLSDWLEHTVPSMEGRSVDHGLLSMEVIRSLKRYAPDWSQQIDSAAHAAALHNLWPMEAEGKQKDPNCIPKITFCESPIAALLILCDQLQVWERENRAEFR